LNFLDEDIISWFALPTSAGKALIDDLLYFVVIGEDFLGILRWLTLDTAAPAPVELAVSLILSRGGTWVFLLIGV